MDSSDPKKLGYPSSAIPINRSFSNLFHGFFGTKPGDHGFYDRSSTGGVSENDEDSLQQIVSPSEDDSYTLARYMGGDDKQMKLSKKLSLPEIQVMPDTVASDNQSQIQKSKSIIMTAGTAIPGENAPTLTSDKSYTSLEESARHPVSIATSGQPKKSWILSEYFSHVHEKTEVDGPRLTDTERKATFFWPPEYAQHTEKHARRDNIKLRDKELNMMPPTSL